MAQVRSPLARPAIAPPARAPASYTVYAESFNRSLKVLTIDLARRYRGDADVYRAKERIMTVVAYDPLFVINEVGPYLYKYREQIYQIETDSEAVEEFFLGQDFKAEFDECTNKDKIDLVKALLPKVKATVRTLQASSADEKQQYKALIVSLLDDYVEYLAALHEAK
jgi:hypothetical protein